MPFYASPLDNCQLHYLSYSFPSPNVTLIFLHGWPMSSIMYAHLFPALISSNIGVIALDRRGFGKSEYNGNKYVEVTYDTFASDTLALLKQLDEGDGESCGLGSFVLVGASMACGESLLVYNQLKSTSTLRTKCKGFIWLGPSLPFPLKTESNPAAPPRELWDVILTGLRDDRFAFTKAAMPGIFGHGTIDGVTVNDETLKAFADIVAQADIVAIQRCIEIITNRDFTQDLEDLAGCVGEGGDKIKLLVLHGDSDQGMPYEASSKIIKELIPNVEVKIYEKAAHGLYLTHKEKVVEDILEFVGNVCKAA